MCEFILFIELEKEYILLSTDFMKLRNEIAENINVRNKSYLMLHGLIFSFEMLLVIQQRV